MSDTMNYADAIQNPEPFGFRWESEEVSLRAGANDSDKRSVNDNAQIAVMTNVSLFEVAFPGFILASEDGTSLRVICQRVGRRDEFHGGKKVNQNREAVVNAIRGIRSKGVTTRRGLPDGTFYTGTDEVEYRQMYAAALVEQGVGGDIATSIAKHVAF